MSVDYQTESLSPEDAPSSRFSVSGGLVAGLIASAVSTVRMLTERGVEGINDSTLISLVGSMEELKRASGAAQTRLTHDLRETREAAAEQQKLSTAKAVRGAGAEIALARREPANRANRLIGLAQALVTEMPNTLAALNAGLISEWAATLVVKETAVLSPEHRHDVDVSLAEHFGTCRDARLGGLARAYGMTLDPESHARRLAKAMADRNVSCRPAPDTMTYLTALLPVADGVAVQAELIRAADAARAAGDPRTRGQVMADTLVQRLTGRRASQHRPDRPDDSGSGPAPDSGGPDSGDGPTKADGRGDNLKTDDRDDEKTTADDAEPSEEPSRGADSRSDDSVGDDSPDADSQDADSQDADSDREGSDDSGDTSSDGTCRCTTSTAKRKPADISLNLLLSGEALFTANGSRGKPGGYDNIAWLDGEPIPAWLARDLVTDPNTTVKLRRIFTHPHTGQLIAMDSRATHFDDGLRRLVQQRDQRCRLCDAPIRHIDHIRPRRTGGPTSADNGQGVCEFCNYLKETPGWSQETVPDPDHPNAPPVVRTRTAGGHTYYSRAPGLRPDLRKRPHWRARKQQPADRDEEGA